jgi:hypothetical protein
MLFLWIWHEPSVSVIAPAFALIFLPLLLCMEALVCLAVLLPQRRSVLMAWYQILAIPAIICTIALTVFGTLFVAIDEALGGLSLDVDRTAILLLLAAFILAFVGCLFVPDGKHKAED